MANRIIKEAFNRYFAGDISGYNNFLIEKWSYPGLTKEGFLDPHYRSCMLRDYTLSGWVSEALKEIVCDRPVDLTDLQRDILIRSGILNDTGRLTHDGRCKSVSLLPIAQQIRILGLQEDQFFIPRPSKYRHRIEPTIREYYEQPQRLVAFDEGHLIRESISTFCYGSRRYINECNLPEKFYRYCDFMEGDFFHTVMDVIRNDRELLISDTQQLRYGVTPERLVEMGLEIRKAILRTIDDLPIGEYVEDLKTHQDKHPKMFDRMPYLVMDLVPDVQNIIEFLGEDRFRALCRKMFLHRRFSIATDLTVVEAGKYIPIEVKGPKDKLRYNQIESMIWFANNFQEYADRQAIATVQFES